MFPAYLRELGYYTSNRVKEDYNLEKTRSEEHTSELQSPVPISYAVFCLKKKKSY